MNIYLGRNDDEIGLMSLLDDLIVLHNGERYTIDGYINKLQQENKQLKELKYKFFDASGDEESFTLGDYLDLSNKVYDLEKVKDVE